MRVFRYIYINIFIRFKQHLKNKAQGRNLIIGMFSFLPFLSRLFTRLVFFPRKNLIYGLGLYHLPVLVTYPRSGTNWIRYIIETLTDKPSPGKARQRKGTDYGIDRAHAIKRFGKHYESMILVLRDYRECLIRHNSELFLYYQNVQMFMDDDVVISKPSWYMENIKSFEEFEGEKLLMYYEDLLNDPEKEIARVGSFLGVGKDRVEAFINDLDTQQQRSINSYSSSHKSFTSGDVNKQDFHSRKHLSQEQQMDFDNYFQSNYPVLFEKYLTRYKIEA